MADLYLGPQSRGPDPIEFALVALPLQVVADGWALWSLWGWFVAPLLGVHIGFWHAAGLAILWGFLRFRATSSDDDYAERLAGVFAYCVVVVPITVLTGWAVQAMMP